MKKFKTSLFCLAIILLMVISTFVSCSLLGESGNKHYHKTLPYSDFDEIYYRNQNNRKWLICNNGNIYRSIFEMSWDEYRYELVQGNGKKRFSSTVYPIGIDKRYWASDYTLTYDHTFYFHDNDIKSEENKEFWPGHNVDSVLLDKDGIWIKAAQNHILDTDGNALEYCGAGIYYQLYFMPYCESDAQHIADNVYSIYANENELYYFEDKVSDKGNTPISQIVKLDKATFEIIDSFELPSDVCSLGELNKLYVHGNKVFMWDSSRADLYMYDIETEKLDALIGQTDNPTKGSRAVAFVGDYLFTAGKSYNDSNENDYDSIKEGLWRYELSSEEWLLVSDDSAFVFVDFSVFDDEYIWVAESSGSVYKISVEDLTIEEIRERTHI